MDEDNKEPVKPKNDSNIIFGVNQAHEGFPNPEFVYPISELGLKLERKLPRQKTVVAHYWERKRKTIALIGAISALAISAILVQETGIFDSIFNTLTNLIISGINLFLGLF